MISRRIVLDANILIRAVLGKRVRELIEQYGAEVAFFVPELAFEEAERHLLVIGAKRGHDPKALLDSLDSLRPLVETVTEEAIVPLRSAALARIGSRDPMDWPVVAASLALSCPVWTEDHDFFGAGVATWTSANVEMDFPVETSPLTRHHREVTGVVEKWDLYVRGFELATGYSELIDPVVQRERFVQQAAEAARGDDEAMRIDEEFLRALEHAMPPSGGMGMGMDRLLMALTGLGIRETILFPLVK
ncbi:Elongation factor P--(R)-beta-lysine ligase [Leucobacter soli]|uniref:Elongation factor P--(R)-beta-lysine ligase n=1 Tax=Leucobacter soli TaxID=2812850 RepID=A0A916JU84_9MICO|nr:Elongation factor P--(R)-beta-lysine ligase [Leucobacter soli]